MIAKDDNAHNDYNFLIQHGILKNQLTLSYVCKILELKLYETLWI